MDLLSYFSAHGFVFELLVSFAAFTWWLKKRPAFPLRALASGAALLGASMVWSLLPLENAWTLSLRYVVFFAVCVAGLFFCYRIRPSQALFHATAAGAAQHFSFKAASAAQDLVLLSPLGESPLSLWVYPALVPVFLGLTYVFFARPLRRDRTDTLKNSTVMAMLVAMLVMVNLFQNFFDVYSQGIPVQLYLLFQLFDLMCCLFVLSLQCAVGRGEGLRRDNDILKHVLHLQQEQMESSKETMDLIQVKCHDLKNQLATLGSRIPQEEIDEFNRAASILGSAVKTGCEALDVLLMEKLLLCESKGIQLSCMADGASLSFLRPAHIYSLLGNAIDNAIEAAGKVPDGERRCISLNIRPDRGMVVVHIENPYQGELSLAGGLPQTTKADRRYHGFGMKSMKMVAERYGGCLSLRAEGGIFSLNILLPIPAAVQASKTTS